MKIKDLPFIERPREKLIRYGPDKLTSAELLAILLGTGIKGQSVIQLAKKVLFHLQEDELSSLNIDKLKTVSGLGSAKACSIIASLELGRRLLTGKQWDLILSPKDVWEKLKETRGQKKEHFIIFYLDVRNQLMKKEVISIGNLNTSIVHPREVFEPAVRDSVAQIILTHNHPSGVVEPSADDITLTKRLAKAGEILGIEIIDHIIVSEKYYFSFKEKGIF